MKKLIIPVLLLLNSCLFAQKDFRPGYVILNSGDTISGEIDFRDDKIMTKTCRFRENEQSETTVYSPGEIFGYRIINGKYYISQELPEQGKTFLEFLVDGKLSLYYRRDEEGADHFFIKKEGDILRELPIEKGLVNIGDTVYTRQPTRLRGLLKSLTQEDPELRNRIENIKVPDQRFLVNLAVDYHDAVCPNEECIIYTKKIPKVKANFQPVAGITHLNGEEGMLCELGTYINFWMPLTNERLYFKTGLTGFVLHEEATSVYDYSENLGVFKIPVQIKYLAPGKSIKPEICVGAMLYLLKESDMLFFGHGFYLSGGLNLRLKEHIYLYTGANLETTPFIQIFNGMHIVSYSLITGVSFKF